MGRLESQVSALSLSVPKDMQLSPVLFFESFEAFSLSFFLSFFSFLLLFFFPTIHNKNSSREKVIRKNSAPKGSTVININRVYNYRSE